METALFNVSQLRKCSTKLAVSQYFESVGISSLEQKIAAISQAINAGEVDYIGNVSLESQYESLLTLFLDEEFRWLKGIM